MSSIIRSMSRSIARTNMKNAGYTKADRGKERWSEFFSRNWRKFASYRKGEKRR